jgi:uncharacterized protein
MSSFEKVFGIHPVLLPVIHPIGRAETLAAARVATSLGVPGVFIIDQNMHESSVLRFVQEIRDQHPALWIGVNLLTRTPADALTLALRTCSVLDGLWSDNANIDECACATHQLHAETFCMVRHSLNWHGLYFGGVAFKYQREIREDDLGRAASAATAYMDVVCTSGPGTGQAASLEKVRALRAGLGGHPMALASGITPENVRDYLPHVQAFLVGTGIEERLGVLDPAKIERLLRAME